jgi:hypothetical protein
MEERRYGWLEGMSRVGEEEEERKRRGRGKKRGRAREEEGEGEEEEKRVYPRTHSILGTLSSVLRLHSALSTYWALLMSNCMQRYVPCTCTCTLHVLFFFLFLFLFLFHHVHLCHASVINQIVGAWTGRQLSSLSQL